MARPEHDLQCAAWVYAQHVLPDSADYASIETKIGLNAKRQAGDRKAAGVRAGEPDARVVWLSRVTFVEFKSPTGSVSPAQKKRHAELRRAGSEVYVVSSIAALKYVFLVLGIPLRFHALTVEDRDRMLAVRHGAPKKRATTQRK